MTVRIVTDSTCDLPAKLLGDLAVTVVPLTVAFGDESFLDGVEMQSNAFFDRMRAAPGLPKTSQPPVARFAEAYAPLLADGDEIVSIHLSEKLSGTLNSARLAVEQLPDPSRVTLVDSQQVSLGLGAIVVEAAKAARDGASASAVAALARALSGRVHIIAAVDTLEYLRRGGRIGRARSMLGSLLSIKPIIHVEGGEIAPLERVRTRARALDRLVELATNDPEVTAVYVGSAGDDAAAEALAARIRPLAPGVEVTIGFLGPAVGVHSGPGLIGICAVRGLGDASAED